MFKFIPIFILALVNISLCCPGCIELDEISYEKIIKKFKTALVKFDQSFPYGERHETFAAFSQLINNKTLSESEYDHPDILISTVSIKDYGDLENKKLADRYHVKTDAFPVIKLFIEGDLESPIDFNIGSDPFSITQLFTFLKRHSKAYISAPGCDKKLDELSDKFMLNAEKRREILKQAEDIIEEIKCEERKQVLKFYCALMKGVLENEEEFIGIQDERMNKLLKEKISKKKVDEINKKLNIIASFRVVTKSAAKNEL